MNRARAATVAADLLNQAERFEVFGHRMAGEGFGGTSDWAFRMAIEYRAAAHNLRAAFETATAKG